MRASPLRGAPPAVVALAGAALVLSACNVDLSMRAEARDQWQRRYPIARGGTLEIRNTNGVIRVEPGDAGEIDVSAERLVQAGTDQAAKEALAAFEIQESVAPDRVAIDSGGRGVNLTFNMSRRVDYRVRAPRWLNLRLTTTNGNIEVTPGLTGTFHAETTNGRISATALENGASATTTNGTITLDVAKLGEEGLSCETTNGAISLTVPATINARLSARVTNGGIRPEGLPLAISEQSRRRLDATLGAGGPAIRLETTNGAISIKGR